MTLWEKKRNNNCTLDYIIVQAVLRLKKNSNRNQIENCKFNTEYKQRISLCPSFRFLLQCFCKLHTADIISLYTRNYCCVSNKTIVNNLCTNSIVNVYRKSFKENLVSILLKIHCPLSSVTVQEARMYIIANVCNCACPSRPTLSYSVSPKVLATGFNLF